MSEFRTSEEAMVWRGIESRDGSWKEKRESMLQSLRTKVDFVGGLLSKCESLGLEADVDQVLEQLWEEGLKKFGSEIEAKAKLAVDLQHRFEEARDAAAEHDFEEYFNENSETNQLFGRLEEMRSSEEISFLLVLREAVDNLKRKHEVVRQIPDTEKAVLAQFKSSAKIKKNIDPNEIMGIKRDAFGITIVLSKNEYEKVFGDDTGGLHYKDTPFNVVKESSPEDQKAIMHHEQIHNLTDGSIPTDDPTPAFLSRLKRFMVAKGDRSYHKALRIDELANKEFEDLTNEELDDILDPDYSTFGMLIRHEARLLLDEKKYLDFLHGEIVAAFEQAEERGFNKKFFLSTEFESRSYAFSTAGKYARGLARAISTERGNTNDEELKGELGSLEKRIKRRFVDTVEKMQQLLVSAELGGSKAREEVESLFFILPPSKYSHIRSYVERFYGEGLVSDTEKLLALGEFNDLYEMEEGFNLVKDKPKLLTPELKKKILDRMERLSGSFLGTAKEDGLGTIEEKRHFVSLAKELGALCGGGQNLEFFVNGLEHAYMDAYIMGDFRNEFEGLEAFYATLNADEKDELKSALMVYMHFIGEDLDLEDISDIKKRPMWKRFEAIGVAKALEAEIEQKQKSDRLYLNSR